MAKSIINKKGKIRNNDNPLNATWRSMIARCYNEKNKRYASYGGRGIRMCDEWLGEDGFQNFCNWSLRYGWHRGLQIDRIDNDGDYCPENCRWVTIDVQNNNKRNVKRIEFSGLSFTISQLAQFLDVDYEYLRGLLKKDCSVEEAVEKAIKNGKPYTPYNQTVKAKRRSNKRHSEKKTNTFYTTIVVKTSDIDEVIN